MCIRDWITDAARGLDFVALTAARVSLVVVLPVPLWALQRFVEKSLKNSPELAASIFADERAAAAAALDCTKKFTTAKLKPDTIHAHTSVTRAALWGIGEGIAGGGAQGDPRQMGGAWVLNEKGEAVWAHKDQFNADQVPLPALMAAAGLPEHVYKHHLRDKAMI